MCRAASLPCPARLMLAEAPVWIALNGVRRIMLTCAPTQLEALAVGHLLAEGWIGSAADVRSLRVSSGPGGSYGVELDVGTARVTAVDALRRHQLEHGCGLRHLLDCTAEPVSAPAGTPPAELSGPFRDLFAAADSVSPQGGVHAAALYDGATLRHTAVDVARHCAVDRAIGFGCLAGDALAGYGLLLTARVSGAMALKAARGGVGWIASRSFATPLARELAAATGLTIIEQAARRDGRGGP
jgi:FdhD protein